MYVRVAGRTHVFYACVWLQRLQRPPVRAHHNGHEHVLRLPVRHSQDPWLELLRERIRESSVSAYNSPEFTRLRENLFATIAAVLATASGWFAP